ncbi:DNA topoisomerase 2, partial [Perkinsus olseni]
KNHMWLFVNALIENPTFDSQTKETLTLKIAKFGSKCALGEGTMKKVLNSGIVDQVSGAGSTGVELGSQVVNWAKFKQTATLQSKMKGGTGGHTRILGIPKLEDANDAGGRHSDRCTLILTEGDSAKALAVAGLGVIGRDKYGVFPLRGKVLNVREASYKQTVDNKEIQAILKIIGLEPRKAYDGVKGLRYGSIMVMTDQDLDGSHIKGLLINLVHHWWPGLLQTRGFMKEFVTPIVKCVKGRRELSFFTLTEYEEWKRNNNDGKGWKIKYYKGLGTSTSKEAKEYFSQITKHSLSFDYRDGDDGEAIDMA